MRKFAFYFVLCIGLFLSITLFQQPLLKMKAVDATEIKLGGVKEAVIAKTEESEESEESETSALANFDQLVKNTQKLDGLFTLYRDRAKGKIFLELKPDQLNKNYLANITLASGIGEQGLLSGMPLQSFLFYFRRVNNNLLFTLRNVSFRTSPDDPQGRSVARSFSDSVLYSLKIKSIHPQRRTLLVDLGDLLLKDVAGLNSLLRNSLDARYELDANKSYFGTAQVFPLNIEVDSMYGFSLSDDEDNINLQTLPDSRALSLRIHYSFSQLPENNLYSPRLADERVGYFHTAYKDFSNDNRRDPFVRYIHRWHLEKQDPKASISPPKQPIVFWIENAVPLEYRAAISEGILMWNRAFAKAGFKDAIEVRQMPDNATWNPADIRYNTIRWINSLNAAFALGPSRYNPLTGEILDADILIDANFVRLTKQEYRSLIENQPAGNLSLKHQPCDLSGASNQLAIGAIALSLLQDNPSGTQEFIHQFVRELVAHEVGHTLGLRHNFRASTLLKPEELNNTNLTRSKGMVSSVMDYNPVNLASPGTPQGDYFPTIVGPYDEWAIEYGYTPSNAPNPTADKQFLQPILQKQANNPALSYATDEDLQDLDPTVNQYDLSSDPLEYSHKQLDNARRLWERLNQSSPSKDEGYSELTDQFNQVYSYYWRQLNFITKYIGGQSFYRDRRSPQSLPFEPVPAAKQQQALTILQKYAFAADAFNFPPELLNKLAPSRWDDLGNNAVTNRLDYPIGDRIFSVQSTILNRLLSGGRLTRLRDLELKTSAGQTLTMPELFNTLQASIWTEIDAATNVSSPRRSLQREHLRLLVDMVLRKENVPEDARSLAWAKIRQLRSQIDRALRKARNLDEYTKVHLEETRERITKVLDAPLQSKRSDKK